MRYAMLFFLLSIAMLSNAQTCDRLKVFNFTQVITLGGTFADNLRGYGIEMPNDGDTSFAIGRYKITDRPDLLKLLSFEEDFKTLAVYTGKNRKINSIVLIKDGAEEDQTAFDAEKDPPFFLKMTEVLTKQFGRKRTSGVKETELGRQGFAEWRCGDTLVELLYSDVIGLSFNIRISDVKLLAK